MHGGGAAKVMRGAGLGSSHSGWEDKTWPAVETPREVAAGASRHGVLRLRRDFRFANVSAPLRMTER